MPSSQQFVCASAISTERGARGLLSRLQRLWSLLTRAIRTAMRATYLMSIASPLAVVYPLTHLHPRLREKWLSLVVFGVECSGAAVVKLFQWASSRPDMFGDSFCSVFKKLQDNTSPHSFRHTKAVLASSFGKNWENLIEIDERSPILGSGCIGQVYRCKLKEEDKEIALKILHPNVEGGIDADLDILRFVAVCIDNYDGNHRWLNFPGMVEEFAGLLKEQLDLKNEAKNLRTFRINFRDDDDVIFPKVFLHRKNVLVMEYMKGDSLDSFLDRQRDNPALLKVVCDKGITAVCKMIFEHNFVHGDVHPGNILFSRDAQPRLVLLDAGIAKKFERRDHQLLVDVLSGFIQGDGKKAGRALIRDSINRTSIVAEDENGFVQVLDDMCEQAKRDRSFFDSIGNYVTKICAAASTHKIMMNQGFVSIALTVRVMEGVAFALNPEAEIWRIANKIVMKVKVEEAMGKVGGARFRRFLTREIEKKEKEADQDDDSNY